MVKPVKGDWNYLLKNGGDKSIIYDRPRTADHKGLSETCSVSHKLEYGVHKTNLTYFTRISPKDRCVSKALPHIVRLRRQKVCLCLVKSAIRVAHVLAATESQLNSNLTSLHDALKGKTLNRKIIIQGVLSNLKDMLTSVKSTIENFKSQYLKIFDLESFEQVVTIFRHRFSTKELTDCCNRIAKCLIITIIKLIELMKCEDLSIEIIYVSCISICSILCSKIMDFIASPCFTNVMDFETCINNSFLHSEQRNGQVNSIGKETRYIVDLAFFLKETALKRSHWLSARLSTATLETVNTFFIQTNSTQEQLVSSKTRPVVRMLKSTYKKMLDTENEFFTQLIKSIQVVNTETLRKNSDALQQTRRGSSAGRRTVNWDSYVAPGHHDFLFSVYMDALWSNVKRHVILDYIESFYGRNCSEDRLFKIWLASFEQDMLWQIHLKLNKNGSSPQPFVDILAFLAVGIKSFWCQRKFFLGLSTSMGVLIKDRFRNTDTVSMGTPITPTFKELMHCYSCLNEQMSLLEKYKIPMRQDTSSHGVVLYSMVYPLVTYFQFLRRLLLSKRQQFLLSATWEQYLVLTTSGLKFALLSCERANFLLKRIVGEDTEETAKLDEYFHFLEAYEKGSTKLLVHQIGQKSRSGWKDHMVNKKFWKRRGTRQQVYQASSYINVVIQLIFGPLLENAEILSHEQKIDMLSKCVTVFVKTWMDHILGERIIFSWYGAQQLHFDFAHFVSWFDNEDLGLTLDEISEIHSLPILSNMRNAILLLACQPDGQKKRNEEVNLMANKHGGSSTSTISQVSIESVAGWQFEEVIQDIELHDKERWLALRAKGGQAKRFLCMT